MAKGTVPPAEPRRAAVARAVTAGFAVAVLDGASAVLLCAAVNSECTALRVFQGIAAGLMGRAAFGGGPATAALGVALHFVIATGWSSLFVIAVRRLPALRRALEGRYGALTVGPAYGVVVWACMRFVVVPLSRARPSTGFTWVTVAMIVVHMVAVGLPIAIIARGRRHARATAPSSRAPLPSIRARRQA